MAGSVLAQRPFMPLPRDVFFQHTQVSFKHLQPQQTVTLVKRGLSDSSEAVVEACRFMLCAHWFRDVGYDSVELLKRLDVLQYGVRPVRAVGVRGVIGWRLRCRALGVCVVVVMMTAAVFEQSRLYCSSRL